MDTLCHKIPNFIEKCARAGVRRVFIGLENINPDSLVGAKKRQNKITEYRKMLLAWKAARVITYAGYILGFPNDTPESIRHDIEIIKKELPVDLLEFFFLTPLPGSEDHQKLVQQRRRGRSRPEQVRPQPRHAPRIRGCRRRSGRARTAWRGRRTTRTSTSRRCCAAWWPSAASASNAILLMTWFGGSIHIERCIRSRRDSSATSSAATAGPDFADRAARGSSIRVTSSRAIAKLGRWFSIYAGLRRIYMRIKTRSAADTSTWTLALTPVTDDEIDTLELFHHTEAAEKYSAMERPRVAATM